MSPRAQPATTTAEWPTSSQEDVLADYRRFQIEISSYAFDALRAAARRDRRDIKEHAAWLLEQVLLEQWRRDYADDT